MIIRPWCNTPDKTLYDVTFGCRFLHGKQMIVCEQTRLCAVVLVDCFIKVCLGYSVLHSACIKQVRTSQWAVTQVCAEFNVVWFIAVKWWF